MEPATIEALRSRVAELHSSYSQDLRVLERDRREVWADFKDLTSMGLHQQAPQTGRLEARLDDLTERIHALVQTLVRLDEYEDSLKHVDDLGMLSLPAPEEYVKA